MDDPQLMARQFYERMTIDELHELVQPARKARDEKLEECVEGASPQRGAGYLPTS